MSDEITPPPPPANLTPPAAPSPDNSSGDVPAYGSGKLSVADDKLYCTLSHLLSLIIWLWKKDESPAVNVHGKEALNFHITLALVFVACAIITMIPVLGKILGCIFIIVYPILGLGGMALSIIGALKANDGKLFRYPVNLRLIK